MAPIDASYGWMITNPIQAATLPDYAAIDGDDFIDEIVKQAGTHIFAYRELKDQVKLKIEATKTIWLDVKDELNKLYKKIESNETGSRRHKAIYDTILLEAAIRMQIAELIKKLEISNSKSQVQAGVEEFGTQARDIIFNKLKRRITALSEYSQRKPALYKNAIFGTLMNPSSIFLDKNINRLKGNYPSYADDFLYLSTLHKGIVTQIKNTT